MKAYSYESVLLLDTKGKIMLALGEQHDSPEVSRNAAAAALRRAIYRAATCFWMKTEAPGWISSCRWSWTRRASRRLRSWFCARTSGDFCCRLIEKWPVTASARKPCWYASKVKRLPYLNSRRHLKNDASRPPIETTSQCFASKDLTGGDCRARAARWHVFRNRLSRRTGPRGLTGQ